MFKPYLVHFVENKDSKIAIVSVKDYADVKCHFNKNQFITHVSELRTDGIGVIISNCKNVKVNYP